MKASEPAYSDIKDSSTDETDTHIIRAKIQLRRNEGPIYEIKLDDECILCDDGVKIKTYTLYDEHGKEVNSGAPLYNGKFWSGSYPYLVLTKTKLEKYPWTTILNVKATERDGLRFYWY